MTVVAGIDEAGLGPVLGPLVVSAASFDVPAELAGVSLWRLLAGAVARKPSKRKAAVAIADSKKLYSGLRGKDGLEHLERGVLSMLAVLGRRPASLRELLDVLAPSAWAQAQAYPWYAGDLALPRCVAPESVALSANALAAGMAAADVALLELRSEPVLAGEYNRLVEATRNKSTLLFDVTARLLARLWARADAGPVHVHVDHHGGRIRYQPALQRLFAGCELKILEEDEPLSAYRIRRGRREAHVVFATDGEDRFLPVALASMVSKYLRELFMVLLNRFWAQRLPDLAPTAGYYRDGNRFYGQILPELRRLGLDEAMLHRSR